MNKKYATEDIVAIHVMAYGPRHLMKAVLAGLDIAAERKVNDFAIKEAKAIAELATQINECLLIDVRKLPTHKRSSS